MLADLHVHQALDRWMATTPTGVTVPELHGTAKGEFNPTRAPWRQMHEAGVDLICVAHFNVFDEWLSMPTDPSPDAPAHTHRMLDLFESALRNEYDEYARLITNPLELDGALRSRPGDPEYRVGAIHTLEGGHALGGDPAQVEVFARRGVALITVGHFFHKGLVSAPNAYPFFPDANSQWSPTGLSDLGRDVIAAMEEHSVIVDISHMTDHGVSDILKCATRPLVATHSSARVLGDHPYSMYDEHIQELVQRGGLFGVILYPHVLSNYAGDLAEERGSLDDVVRTVLHVMKITGSHEQVAIGSDTSGYIQAPQEMRNLGEIEKLRRKLWEEIGDDDVVEDIMANNTIRFLRENWGRSSGP